MEKLTGYLFDNMFRSSRTVSGLEKKLVLTGISLFVIASSIILAMIAV